MHETQSYQTFLYRDLIVREVKVERAQDLRGSQAFTWKESLISMRSILLARFRRKPNAHEMRNNYAFLLLHFKSRFVPSPLILCGGKGKKIYSGAKKRVYKLTSLAEAIFHAANFSPPICFLRLSLLYQIVQHHNQRKIFPFSVGCRRGGKKRYHTEKKVSLSLSS